MKRSKRIGVLAELEQHESDNAARVLADAQRMLREREAVLAELRRYRDDYTGNSRLRTATVSVVAFQDYQRFVARLDEAIAQQGRLVNDAQQQYELRRGEWIAARGRTASLDKAVERYRVTEQRAASRFEQGRLDEAASRQQPGPLLSGNEPLA
jgi:flagellar protein FliJ